METKLKRKIHAKPGQYVWSWYWRSWDRVLAVDGREVKVVTVTPVNGNWREVGEIRTHATPLERRDVVVDELPAEVEAEVVKHLGEDRAKQLLAVHPEQAKARQEAAMSDLLAAGGGDDPQ